MQLRLFLWLPALTLVALVPNLAAAADNEHACPVTTPTNPAFVAPAPYQPNAAERQFWFGTNALWTQLPVEGVWRGLPPRDSKGYFNKLFLWSEGFDWRKEQQPDIFVVLRRLDVQTPLVISRGGTTALFRFNNTASMLTGILFPTEGCWELNSYHDGHTLTFVVSIQP